MLLLLASALGSRLRMFHLVRHLRFDGIKIETRAFLHWRIFEEGLEFLAHHLLDENKAPELELEPIEVLLRAFFRPIVWPSLALEWIETQVDQIWHVNVCLFTQPALGLIDETIFVVVDTNRADRAFTKIEDFMTRGRTLACDGVHLVIPIQVVLVSPVAELHTFKQLVGDIRVASGGEEGGEPVQAGEDSVLNGVRRDMAGPAKDARHAETALEDGSFTLRERCRSAIGPGEDFGAIVGGEDDDGVVVQTEVLELLQHQTDVVIELGHAGFFFRPAVFRVAHLLVLVREMGHDVHPSRIEPAEEWLAVRFSLFDELQSEVANLVIHRL